MNLTPYETAILNWLRNIHDEIRSSAIALRDISDVMHAEYYQHHTDPITEDSADQAWNDAIHEDLDDGEEHPWIKHPGSSTLFPPHSMFTRGEVDG